MAKADNGLKDRKLRVGIIGAGGIAGVMAHTVSLMEEAENYAIASRSIDKASKFAREHGFTKAYGSYEELLSDEMVDLVYIATPHSHHCEWTIKALEKGRAVLCEKAFAYDEEEAGKMIALSHEKGILLAEAIWTRYMPSRKLINDCLATGIIGDIVYINANLCYCISGNERLIRPELAGGALLDLTVYPINFCSMIMGDDIRKITADFVMTDTGVDGQDTVVFTYDKGVMASMYTSIYTQSDRMGIILGTKGMIRVTNINNPEKIEVFDNKRGNQSLLKEIIPPKQITGYEYEILACKRALEEGRIECPEMPHSEILEIMRQMDKIKLIAANNK